jgi:hypothetical protein
MGSWQTGHLARSPLDWSKTTVFPQWGHSRLASLSVRTSMTLPQAHSIFFRAKNPVFASAYRPHTGHSMTNLDMAFSPHKHNEDYFSQLMVHTIPKDFF